MCLFSSHTWLTHKSFVLSKIGQLFFSATRSICNHTDLISVFVPPWTLFIPWYLLTHKLWKSVCTYIHIEVSIGSVTPIEFVVLWLTIIEPTSRGFLAPCARGRLLHEKPLSNSSIPLFFFTQLCFGSTNFTAIINSPYWILFQIMHFAACLFGSMAGEYVSCWLWLDIRVVTPLVSHSIGHRRACSVLYDGCRLINAAMSLIRLRHVLTYAYQWAHKILAKAFLTYP